MLVSDLVLWNREVEADCDEDVNPYASFAINFVAIMPLAGILSFATEELSLRYDSLP